MQYPDFWKDHKRAGRTSQELVNLKEEITQWQDIERDLAKIIVLEEDPAALESIKVLEQKISKEEIKTFLSGQYDKQDAILSIYSGAGGIEAQDWAEMLLRMYLRYAERRGLKAQVLHITAGQEAGIKNVTIEIKGNYVYGYLKGESGVHRLVRLSPFNAAKLRHTSFALVEVLPEFEELSEIKIKSEDLRIDTYRASGPGGQYVNKTESAVRITHLSTGLVAACQSERLQGANKERAMKLLYAKFYQRELQKKEEEQAKMRGKIKKGKGTAEWGSQIRSYVLHPYKMVKDLRTRVESREPDRVLNGELDEFIEAELKNLI